MPEADPWTVVHEGVRPDKEAAFHTIFAVGNGCVGIRGALAELPAGGPPETYLAGFYDRLVVAGPNVANWSPYLAYWSYPELTGEVEHKSCIVNCPNPLDAAWTLDGERVDFTTGTLRRLVRRLDLRRGEFTAEAEWTSPGGRTIRWRHRRFADLVRPERAFAQWQIEAAGFSGRLGITAGVNADTEYVTYRALEGEARMYEVADFLRPAPACVGVLARGRHAGMTAGFATALRMSGGGAAWSCRQVERRIDLATEVPLEAGRPVVLERVAAFASGHRHDRPLHAAGRAALDGASLAFDDALAASSAVWETYWHHSDVLIDGSPEDQRAARFSLYHLLIAASRDDERVSIPVKSLTGGGYRGLTYWDTDIYMTPFFNFTQPALARNLASFRYHTLSGARAKAARLGCRGAAYPWSTDATGVECETAWSKNITHQHHVTADVAYAMQQYLDCSGDANFHVERAAEVFIETARFWVSRARPLGQMVSIPAASGPDEYHCDCSDNACVNHLAAWNLSMAAAAVAHLKANAPDAWDALRRRTGITDAEVAAFSGYPPRIRTMQRPGGLFEQCDGFFALRDEVVHDRQGAHPHLSQTLRQADVLMLFYLFPGRWPASVVRANWDYYEPRTLHASSLSHPAHGVIAAELGLGEVAYDYLRRCLGMDLNDEMANAHLGAHMATNGMTWVALVRGFGGTWPWGDRLRVRPRLPAGWTRLAFRLKWRGADVRVDIRPGEITVANLPEATASLPLALRGAEHLVAPGQTVHG